MTLSREWQRAAVLIVACGIALGCGADGDADDTTAKVGTGGSGSNQDTQMHVLDTGGTGTSAIGSGGRAASGHAGSGGGEGSGSGGTTPNGTGGAVAADAGMRSFCVAGETKLAEGESVPAGDGCNSCTCTAGMVQCTMIDCTPHCVVATHLDQCCGEYEPMWTTDLAADECLVAYPGTAVDAQRFERCQAKRGACTTALCPQSMPLSRVAAEDGMGGCRFSDECQNNDDCVLAVDTNACCACTESLPASLLERDACLSRQNPAALKARPVPLCPGCTAPVECGMCEPTPEMATCLIQDSFSRCQ